MQYKTAEEILKSKYPINQEIYFDDLPDKAQILEAMHEYHNQFQTPAGGGSEPEFKEMANIAYPNYEGIGNNDCGLTYDKLRSLQRYTYAFGLKAGYELHQSSQPQPNAISVIEERIKELCNKNRNQCSDVEINTVIIIVNELNDLLTQLKKQP